MHDDDLDIFTSIVTGSWSLNRAQGTLKSEKRVYIEQSDVRVKRMVRKAGDETLNCFITWAVILHD